MNRLADKALLAGTLQLSQREEALERSPRVVRRPKLDRTPKYARFDRDIHAMGEGTQVQRDDPKTCFFLGSFVSQHILTPLSEIMVTWTMV